MEGRRRRESAKASAATVLPSTQDKDFHLRLIDLYGKHDCLWNTSLDAYENKELKEQAWQNIVNSLGSHLSSGLLKSRISNLRHGLNVYKLQEIEYKMCPNNAKQPEKPYYSDRFDFLEKHQTLDNQTKEKVKVPFEDIKRDLNRQESRKNLTESIADIVKQRLAKHPKLPMDVLKKRLQISTSSNKFMIPDFSIDCPPRLSASSLPSILKARPGESVSRTKLIHDKSDTEQPQITPLKEEEVKSEDEELYHQHWNLRQKMSSRRHRSEAIAIIKSLDQRYSKPPPIPLTLRTIPPIEPTDDII